MLELIKNNKQKIALAVGFVAVACLGYFGGQSINSQQATKPAKTSSQSTSNYTQTTSGIQTQQSTTSTQTAAINCDGKIKGSSSMIYHMPDGAFYKRVTNPIRCFDTEAEAIAAGFRKSSR